MFESLLLLFTITEKGVPFIKLFGSLFALLTFSLRQLKATLRIMY